MDDFLEFDEKEREHDVLQKRLVLEKKVLLLPLVPHISHTAAEEKHHLLFVVSRLAAPPSKRLKCTSTLILIAFSIQVYFTWPLFSVFSSHMRCFTLVVFLAASSLATITLWPHDFIFVWLQGARKKKQKP